MKKTGALILLWIVFLNVCCAQFFSAPAEAQLFIVSTASGSKIQDTAATESCPAEYPVDCGDGSCCTPNTVCVADNQCCPEIAPYYCGNYNCAASVADCPAAECPAQKVLGADDPKLEYLRSFRDSRLAQSFIGSKVIELYYNNAAGINAALDRSPALRAVARRALEAIAPMLGGAQE